MWHINSDEHPKLAKSTQHNKYIYIKFVDFFLFNSPALNLYETDKKKSNRRIKK